MNTVETGNTSDRAIRPPFRILPARDRNLTIEAAGSIAGGLCAAIGGAVALQERRPSGLAFMALLGGLVVLFFGTTRVVREYRYFHPRNEYALVIGLEEFKVVTPDGINACTWSDLAPFESKKTVTKHKGVEHISYGCVARVGGVYIEISLRDFAVRLGSNNEERAIGITKALNQVRDLMRARQSGEAAPLFDPPLGLVVGPLLPPRKTLPVNVKSVVQRQ